MEKKVFDSGERLGVYSQLEDDINKRELSTRETISCGYTDSNFRKNFITTLWTILGAVIFTTLMYLVTLYNNQFVTATELRPIEKDINEINIHLIYIKDSMIKIESDLKELKISKEKL